MIYFMSAILKERNTGKLVYAEQYVGVRELRDAMEVFLAVAEDWSHIIKEIKFDWNHYTKLETRQATEEEWTVWFAKNPKKYHWHWHHELPEN